jgi:23S rRNA (uracil1939-C5)-methyltransferase
MLQRVADALMQDCASLGLVSVVHSIEAAAATSAAVAAAAVTATELTGPEHTAISSRLWNDGNLRSGSDVQGDDEAVAGSGLGAMQDQAVQHRQCNGKREQSKGAADRQPKNGNGGSSKVSKRGAQALSVSATTVLAGVSHLQEQLCGLQFSISPHSFFQTNAKQAELLYQQVAAGVQGFYTASSSSSSSSSGDTRDLTANDALTGTVLDLYCGTGTIALTVAGCCRRVIGVDVSASSIADAVDNAQRNGVRNVEFVCGDLAELAHAQNSAAAPGSRGRSSQLSVSPDVIIVDPARAGLSRSVVNYILNSTAKRLMYVSCNAATQARDVQLLCSAWTGANSGMHSHSSTGNRGGQAKHAGKVSPSSVAGSDVAGRDIKGLRPFRLVSWTAVDMFPQTSHVETVVVLDR